MIYLYGLLAPDRPLPDAPLSGLAGLQTAPRIAWLDDKALIYEQHDGSEVLPRRRNMLSHTRVLERAMSYGTVLPARFGLVAEDIEAVAALVVARQAVVLAEFDRLQGCVEYSLRIRYPRETALAETMRTDQALRRDRDRLMGQGPEAHFSRAEFGRKLAEALDGRRATAQKQLVAGLRGHVRDYVLRRPESDTEVLRLEVLTTADGQAGLVDRVTSLLADCTFAPGAEPTVTLVGPAPLYNFVRLSLALDATHEDAA